MMWSLFFIYSFEFTYEDNDFNFLLDKADLSLNKTAKDGDMQTEVS